MHRLFRLLQATDPELAAHGLRAARLAGDVGHHLGLLPEAVERIEGAARIHDIGKLVIPREILDKPGPLDAAEWVELQKHPATGYDLIRQQGPMEFAGIVLAHHERYDGSGYPNALNAGKIPFEARVLQVADAFDAITSVRPYQDALPVGYALSELKRCSGTQFDPDAVAALVSLCKNDAWLRSIGLSESPVTNVVAV